MNESKMGTKALALENPDATDANAKVLVHAFIETAFTNDQVAAAITAEERAGIRDEQCAFLDGPMPLPVRTSELRQRHS